MEEKFFLPKQLYRRRKAFEEGKILAIIKTDSLKKEISI
jgi:hypothetical protein